MVQLEPETPMDPGMQWNVQDSIYVRFLIRLIAPVTECLVTGEISVRNPQI